MLLDVALALALLLGGSAVAQTTPSSAPNDTGSETGSQPVDPGGETDARAYIIDLG